ncbi:hypothetical protein CSE45_4823 [Citreicella sp. SE45]|uniref:Uncharacterized protein n=1 Tax=Salipiger thiooxidans TaxID=282683 RepID=A0A1G7FHP4_9RHOB|nr:MULTISPECIES: hypothetical protein [Salipiger]EEX11645.1 hypothetical protein CSE45_4823 [Citreicella sp. SE45]NIY94726.1 hypothetical protein [Salipiger sp. HF18]NVK62047.1 hypothetical protein [Paracoccaceae bacterium]SDE75085.1 hypothetical protein SAMN04488105_10762 [Salipiger thiooxidans]
MNAFEKLAQMRRDLEEIRRELTQPNPSEQITEADRAILHDRVSRAIKALSPHG